MENRLMALEKEVQQMKARQVADLAVLDSLVRVLPTAQLQVLLKTFAPLAEDLKVEFIYGSWSEDAHQAVSAKLQNWQETMTNELQARDAKKASTPQL